MMEAELKNNILSLKKVNPTLSDDDIRNYFFRLGYEKDIVEKAFMLLDPDSVSKVVEQSRAEKTINNELVSRADNLKSAEIAKKFLEASKSVVKYKSPIDSERIAVSSNAKSEEIGALSDDGKRKVIPANPYGSEVKFVSEKIVSRSEVPNLSYKNNTNNIFTKKKKKGHPVIISFTILIILVVGLFFTYTLILKDRYFSVIPFEAKSVSNFIKYKNALSVNKSVSINISTKERDRDARPYVPSEEWLAKLAKYARDTIRVRDLSEILKGIQQYSLKNKKYPKTLNELGKEFIDPLQTPYSYSSKIISKKPSFSLEIKFETQEAVQYIGEYKKVTGTNIILNQSDTRSIEPAIIKPTEIGDIVASGGIADLLLSSSFDGGTLSIGISKLLSDNLSKNTKVALASKNAEIQFDLDYKNDNGKIVSKFYTAPSFLQDEIKLDEWQTYPFTGDINKLLVELSKEVLAGGGLNSVAEPQKETNGLSTFYRYDYILEKNSLVKIYSIFANNPFISGNLGLKLLDINEPLRKSEFDTYASYLKDNHILRLWVDSGGNIRKILFEARFIPQLKEFEGKQIILSVISDFEIPENSSSGFLDDIKRELEKIYSKFKK